MAITFPSIDPVLLEFGPIAIRWYSLAYIAGILLGLLYIKKLNKSEPHVFQGKMLDDIVIWMIISIILGGRLGYVIFYDLSYYLKHPLEIIMTWHGGMSFHGGLIGVIIGLILFCKKYKLNLLVVADLIACAAPIGIFFGRIANFINGELYGKITDVEWGVVFPYGGLLPRHPSQIYEAILEGIVPLIILYLLATKTKIRNKKGALSGIFLLNYALARIIVEYFREPDTHLGYIVSNMTMGQMLSLPFLLVAFYLLFHAFSKKNYK